MDETVVREQLGLDPLTTKQKKLIYEMLRYITPEHFNNALSGSYFVLAAIDLYLQLDESKGKRRDLKQLRHNLLRRIIRHENHHSHH